MAPALLASIACGLSWANDSWLLRNVVLALLGTGHAVGIAGESLLQQLLTCRQQIFQVLNQKFRLAGFG
jgi:hypothetical protein